MIIKCALLCGYEGEFSTFKDGLCPKCKGIPKENISKKEIKPRGTPQNITYLSFRVLGFISIWASYLAFSEIEASGGTTSGLPGVLGFGVLVFLGIPLFLSVILGPLFSLIVGWNDGYLMSLTGLSLTLVFSLEIFGSFAFAIPLILFAYGIACLTIGAKWITRPQKQ